MKGVFLKTITAAAVIAFVATGCKKDSEQIEVPADDAGYLVAINVETPDGDGGYFVTAKSLDTGVISSTGNGVELESFSAGRFSKAGNTFMSYANWDDNNIVQGFKISDGKLNAVGQGVPPGYSLAVRNHDDKMIILNEGLWGPEYKYRIYEVDENTNIKDAATLTPYQFDYVNSGTLASGTSFHIRGNKMYVSFYPLKHDTWDIKTDTAYLSVYSYPEYEYITTIKDDRTGPIGAYGGTKYPLFENESGDLYAISPQTKNMTGLKEILKPSGILKVKADGTGFEPDYFFNTETLGYRVFTAEYAGNGKAVARVISVTEDDKYADWTGPDATQLAILDLNAKTLDIVPGVPIHNAAHSFTNFLPTGDGKFYAPVSTETDGTFIYKVDPATGTATKGARIEGTGVMELYKY